MKTIIDDVECTDENSDVATAGATSASTAVQAAAPTASTANCLCTVNRNKTIVLPKTIMIGMANTSLANIFSSANIF